MNIYELLKAKEKYRTEWSIKGKSPKKKYWDYRAGGVCSKDWEKKSTTGRTGFTELQSASFLVNFTMPWQWKDSIKSWLNLLSTMTGT